ncbi:17796_t:CDS:1 [Gigaspora rosea]|nr:17796_t:CDS:1 [Gigaspora rosea]
MYDRFDYELYFTYKKETTVQRQKERSQPEEKEIPQEYLEQLWDIYDYNIEKIYPNYIRIPTDIRYPYHMIRSLFIHEAKGLRRIEEKPITPSMNKCIKNLPITGYTLITPFKFSNSKYQVLAARRSMTTKVYAQQFSYFGGKKETTDKTYKEGVKREALEEINLEVNDYKLQLYMVHKYLSKNRSGTDPVLQTDELEEAKFLVQVLMYLYLMSINDQTRWKYNEPNNMEQPRWMTEKECSHEIWTPSLQYYNLDIFDTHIPNYVHEWTQLGKVTPNLIEDEFPDRPSENQHLQGDEQGSY